MISRIIMMIFEASPQVTDLVMKKNMLTDKTLKNLIKIFLLVLILYTILSWPLSLRLALPARAANDYTEWDDLGIIYTASSGDAYYPSVLYDSNGFGTANPLYKMWYSDGNGNSFLTTSSDGFNWSSQILMSGLGSDSHHTQVLYDQNCFGALPCDESGNKYKIWYWDINENLYSIKSIATAESVDGISWTNDQAVSQDSNYPLVTGGDTGWNRGTYGPVSLFYQPGAPNTSDDPWSYSYVMYYDGTDGSSEVTGLAYSIDGFNWEAYHLKNPVLDRSSGNVWDCDDSVYGTVYHDSNGYHYWYSGSGGNTDSNPCRYGAPVYEGIGYAESTDGFLWNKDLNNPIFHINDGVDYRNKRVYTPSFVNDGSGVLKMYYSAQAIGSDQPKEIGLALNPFNPTAVTLASFTAIPQDEGVLLTWRTSIEIDLLGFNVWRSAMVDEEYAQINPSMILINHPGTSFGASYSWLDSQVQPNKVYYYKLEVVDIHNHTEQFGPISVNFDNPIENWQIFLPDIFR
jgi:hypothetical protein